MILLGGIEAMLIRAGSVGRLLSAATIGAALSMGGLSHAQNQGLVVRDGSLGLAPAGVVPTGLDPKGQSADYLIRADLGEQVGTNLFHSFSEFSIGTGEVATFTEQGATGPVDSIISRVTGGTRSEIDGTLRSTIPSSSPGGALS